MYVELDTATYLAFYEERGLHAAQKALAEDRAQTWVDQRFGAYDRTTWTTPGTTPPSVAHAAELYASAHYIQLDFARFRPNASQRQTVLDLIHQAESEAQTAKDQGLRDTDGNLLTPTTGSGRSIQVFG